MEFVTVYRIEHKDTKIGPFHCKEDNYRQSRVYDVVNHEIGSQINGWWQDGIMAKIAQNSDSYFAGCLDLSYLKDLFNEVLDELTTIYNFVIAEYVVPIENVVEGNSGLQVAFMPI